VSSETARGAQETADERAAYERALRALRRDIGCTWERIAESGLLFSALQERVIRGAGEASVAACIDELRHLVTNLSDPLQREPLLVALGMNETYRERTLTGRRRSYNDHLRSRRLDVDARTLERRENAAIRTLAARLVADSTSTLRQPERASPEAPRASPSRHFRTDSRETWYRFGPNRVLREALNALRLVALVPDASVYLAHSSYLSDLRDGVVEIEPEFGCEPDGETYFRHGVSFRRLRVSRPVALGSHHTLVLRVRVGSDQECRPPLMTAPGQAEQVMTKHVEFFPDSVPEQVWSFAHLTRSEASHDPQQVLLSVGSHRFVSSTWNGTHRGLYYGLTWEWPESST
jgi:hypothetical protein